MREFSLPCVFVQVTHAPSIKAEPHALGMRNGIEMEKGVFTRTKQTDKQTNKETWFPQLPSVERLHPEQSEN